MRFDDEITVLRGVGRQRAEAFRRLGIRTCGDLARFFPRAYEDRRRTAAVAEAPDGLPVCVRAMAVSEPATSRIRGGRTLTRLRAEDDTGGFDAVFFNQTWQRDRLSSGRTYVFFGRMRTDGGRRSMINPEVRTGEEAAREFGRLLPVYRLTEGLTRNFLLSCVRAVLDGCPAPPEPLPPGAAEARGLPGAAEALENIHFPRDERALDAARRRLAFEEFLVLTAALGRQRALRKTGTAPVLPAGDFGPFWSALPYAPTGAQRRAAAEALADMRSPAPMNRLLQGDVGSGKTAVAAALLWQVARAGGQGAFMAPTELLAEQHFHTLTGLLAPLGVTVVKLTGSLPRAGRRQTLEALADGRAQVAVGTHALLGREVAFQRLALVVTDEQHRFGVAQRAALAGKGPRPHVLVMSATPIPRTLAMILYGDLDISVLDELPPGRKPVKTYAVGEEMRPRIWNFVRRLVAGGRQVFLICPAVEPSEALPEGVKSALPCARVLREEIFPDLRVACVHGRMSARERDGVMAAFAAGETDILVATTVVEVGVDVPNAALMIVENAERFGLAQLHQLRGRVGRGEHESFCVLFCADPSETARARLDILTRTGDGFVIAREDLRLRGPGDFLGARQHGLPELPAAALTDDTRLAEDAAALAREILAEDPSLTRPEHAALRERADALLRSV